MFNLEFLAAQVGSEIAAGGDVFQSEQLVADEDGKLTLSKVAVPIIAGGEVKAWVRNANTPNVDEIAYSVDAENKVDLGAEAAGQTFCVLYKYTNDSAKQITIGGQFIPDTLHAVLTVALYSGDSCNLENTTNKAGEITIDIPRFQLSGSTDLTMSATGASQTSLEGNALASGCAGCEGSGDYATVTRVIFNANWYDDVEQVIFDNASRAKAAGAINEKFTPYACYATGAPKAIAADKFTWTISGSGLSVSEAGVVTGTATAGTYIVKAVSKEKATLVASGVITVE